MRWDYLREPEFEKAIEESKGVCVVPIGCLERHGAHSPLGTDTIIAEETCVRAAEIEPCVVFPTMYFGEKSGSGEWKGTVIFSVETRWAIFQETCNEIFRNGFKKILFVNSHGGNSSMLGLFVRGMLEKNPEALIFHTSTGGSGREIMERILSDKERFSYLTDEDRAGLQDYIDQMKGGGHADIRETAKAYHFAPGTCDLDLIQAESGASVHRFDLLSQNKISSPLAWGADFPNSYEGCNEYYFSPTIARAISEDGIYEMAKRFKVLKEETVSTEYHKEWLAKQNRKY